MAEKKSLDQQLAEANKAAQDVLREHAVSQGAHDDEKDSKQNDPKNAPEPNDDDNLEHFEKMREERLAQAAKDLKKDEKDAAKS